MDLPQPDAPTTPKGLALEQGERHAVHRAHDGAAAGALDLEMALEAAGIDVGGAFEGGCSNPHVHGGAHAVAHQVEAGRATLTPALSQREREVVYPSGVAGRRAGSSVVLGGGC